MRRFLQLHLLTSYPPANLNRDDLGRPKTAFLGGANRLRISSQSLKRAWRTSDVFREKLGAIDLQSETGVRTKRLGREVYDILAKGGVKEKDATQWSRAITEQFGKLKSDKEKFPENLNIEQLAFISPQEKKAVLALAEQLAKGKKAPEKKDLDLLKSENSAADIALFGRMIAANPGFNVEAAAQVAHAITVQKVSVEDDYFTAVDDLNRGEEEVGAAHLGDVEFASGVFYLYANIDRELLRENLKGAGKNAPDVYERTLRAFVEASATVAPTGKQNSFGSRAYAHYIMAELGNAQPRTLSLAFLNPVRDRMDESPVLELEKLKEEMDAAYGKTDHATMNVRKKEGSLAAILDFSVQD